MAKSFYPRGCQINCIIGFCHSMNNCLHPLQCEDGDGWMGSKKQKLKPEKASDILPFPLKMKRIVCCKGALADGEPCEGCPNVIPFT